MTSRATSHLQEVVGAASDGEDLWVAVDGHRLVRVERGNRSTGSVVPSGPNGTVRSPGCRVLGGGSRIDLGIALIESDLDRPEGEYFCPYCQHRTTPFHGWLGPRTSDRLGTRERRRADSVGEADVTDREPRVPHAKRAVAEPEYAGGMHAQPIGTLP